MVHPRPEPARQAGVREHNLGLVLRSIAAGGPATRARLAAATGLTKGTVSSLVESLVEARLVTELGPQATAGALGRPGHTVALDPAGPVGIGLEVNVDYVATVTVDLTGAVRHRETVADDLRGRPVPVAMARAALALRRAVDEARAQGSHVAGVAVAVPGLVDAREQVLRLAPNLGWQDVPVLAELRARTGLTGVAMTLDNEANLAALGELWCGGALGRPGDGGPSFVHVSGEVGVGAGIVLSGRVYRGTRGFGGEMGHLPVLADGPPCSCGQRGCLEQVAGQEAILRRAGLGTTASTSTGRPDGSVDELVSRATSGDARAVAAIEDAGRSLGTGVAALVNLLDVDTVVLGGLYATLAPWIAAPVEAELGRRVLGAKWAPVRVLVSSLGGEAAVRGAATSVLREVLDDPSAYLARRAEAVTGS